MSLRTLEAFYIMYECCGRPYLSSCTIFDFVSLFPTKKSVALNLFLSEAFGAFSLTISKT